MELNKLPENIGYAVIIIAIISLCILGAWVAFHTPYFMFFLMIGSTVLSYLSVKNKIGLIKGKHIYDATLASMTIIAFCLFSLLNGHGKYRATISDVFISGHIEKKEVFMGSDGETVDHFENTYSFIPETQSGKVLSELVYWLMLTTVFFCTHTSWKLFVQASNTKKEYEKEYNYKKHY